MNPSRIPGRTFSTFRLAVSVTREKSAANLRENPALKAVQAGVAPELGEPGVAKPFTRPPCQSRRRRLNLTCAVPLRRFSTGAQPVKTEVQPDLGATIDPKKGNSLTDRAALERVKCSGNLSAIGLALVENPRLQDPGQCHINALQRVYAHAPSEVVSHSLDFIEHLDQKSKTGGEAQRAVLGAAVAAFQVLMHLKVSATGRPPHGFDNAESQGLIDTPEAMAAFVEDRGALVVQGTGKAVTASDSGLRKPLPTTYAMEVGEPVLREPDGSVNSNHSVVVLAVATQSDPVPGLEAGQCLVFDQDPHRACIQQALERAGLSQTNPHALTPGQIKEAGVDHLMTRVVSFDDLSQTKGTGNVGFLPIGGLIGGRFFVPQKTV